jgi:hypothetical protein
VLGAIPAPLIFLISEGHDPSFGLGVLSYLAMIPLMVLPLMPELRAVDRTVGLMPPPGLLGAGFMSAWGFAALILGMYGGTRAALLVGLGFVAAETLLLGKLLTPNRMRRLPWVFLYRCLTILMLLVLLGTPQAYLLGGFPIAALWAILAGALHGVLLTGSDRKGLRPDGRRP